MPDENSPSDERIAELERRLAAEPSSRVFLDLARAYHDAGQLEKAAGVCARGLEKHPGWLSARVMLGRIQFDMGTLDDARQAMQEVLDAAPDNLVARRVLAEISLEQGDREGALDRYRALLAFNPADAETRRRIRELEDAGAPAERIPRRWSRRRPLHGPSLLRWYSPRRPSRWRWSLVAGPEAEPAPAPERGTGVEPAPELEPGRESGALATPTLAEIYLQQGLTDQAIDVYREILQGDPSNKEAAARLAEIEASLPKPPDPLAAARKRKVDALSGWLRAIQGEPRA